MVIIQLCGEVCVGGGAVYSLVSTTLCAKSDGKRLNADNNLNPGALDADRVKKIIFLSFLSYLFIFELSSPLNGLPIHQSH